MVVIGVDAHKHSHTLVAVDEVGRRWRATASVDTLIEFARCVAHGRTFRFSVWKLRTAGSQPVRDTAAFNRLLQFEGVKVTEVDFGDDTVTVTVRLQRRKLACPACGFTTWARYDTRPVASSRRHLWLGTWRPVVRAQLLAS